MTIQIRNSRPSEIIEMYWKEVLFIEETAVFKNPEYLGGNHD